MHINTYTQKHDRVMLMFYSNITTVHTQTYLFNFLYNSTMTELEYFGNCMSNTPRADRRQATVVSCLTGKEGQGRAKGGREEGGRREEWREGEEMEGGKRRREDGGREDE